jgi:hypothetical protein
MRLALRLSSRDQNSTANNQAFEAESFNISIDPAL